MHNLSAIEPIDVEIHEIWKQFMSRKNITACKGVPKLKFLNIFEQ